MASSTPPSTRWQAPGRAPSATPALVAGIGAAAFPVVIPAALAWWLARAARREIGHSDGQLDGKGVTTAAYVLAVYSLVATVALVTSAVS